MLLGAILQQAGLVSAKQVQEALTLQHKDNKSSRVGEILAARGYINSKTADFFAESWKELIQEEPKQPIGQYFKRANLLDDRQIQTILEKQKITKLKFGEQAIAEGLLHKTTVDFFLNSLLKQHHASNSDAIAKTHKTSKKSSTQQAHDSFYKIKLKLLNLEEQEIIDETILERVLFWTKGQSFLTQKLFELISQDSSKMTQGKEVKKVDYIVQTRILNSRQRDRSVEQHFKTVEQRLLSSNKDRLISLLKLYQQILTSRVALNQNDVQQELITIGLAARQKNHLVAANPIYKAVFDLDWSEAKLQEIGSLVESNATMLAVSTPAAGLNAVSKVPKRFSAKNILMLLGLIALFLLLLDSLAKAVRVRKTFQQGNQLLQQKFFAEAIAEYNKLLSIDSNYFQAWTNRGHALAGLQKYEEMRQSCSTATIINPAAIYAWNCQGEALHNLERYEEAIAAFDKAIAIDQSEPIFLINKSESLKGLGKKEESLKTITEAIEILEQIEAEKGKGLVDGEFAIALTFLGNGYREQERYEPAIFNYNRALEYSVNYFPAQIGKGIVLNRVKRYQAAKEEFERILENQNLSTIRRAQALFYLGKTLCQSGQNELSISAFDEAIELNPDYQAAKQARENCG